MHEKNCIALKNIATSTTYFDLPKDIISLELDTISVV